MNNPSEFFLDKNAKVIWQPIAGELRLRHPKSGSFQLISKAILSQSMGDFIAEAIQEKINNKSLAEENAKMKLVLKELLQSNASFNGWFDSNQEFLKSIQYGIE